MGPGTGDLLGCSLILGHLLKTYTFFTGAGKQYSPEAMPETDVW